MLINENNPDALDPMEGVQPIATPGLTETLPGYPTASDIGDAISSLGVLNPATLAGALLLMKLDIKAGAAANRWEQLVGWHPYLSSGVSQVRHFDPPGANESGWARGGGRVLDLRSAIVTLNSLVVAKEPNTAGIALVENTDFYVTDGAGNYDADQRGTPRERIDFLLTQWGARRSIVIDAVWGACSALRADVWETVRDFGMYLALAELRMGISHGLFEYKNLNTTIRFAGRTAPLAEEERRWRSDFFALAAVEMRVAM